MLVYTMPQQAKAAAVDDITAALNGNALTELPVTRFQLADAGGAHRAVQRGPVGRVLIDVGRAR
jgi:NADPH2:quinone reductase